MYTSTWSFPTPNVTQHIHVEIPEQVVQIASLQVVIAHKLQQQHPRIIFGSISPWNQHEDEMSLNVLSCNV